MNFINIAFIKMMAPDSKFKEKVESEKIQVRSIDRKNC